MDHEDPDVVKGQALTLVLNRSPAPSAGADVVGVTVHDGAECGEKNGKGPGQHDEDDAQPVAEAIALDRAEERMRGDEEDEESRRDIADVEEPALGKALGRRGEDGFFFDPVEGQDEGQGLLKIGQEKIDNQQDILILDMSVRTSSRMEKTNVANVCLIVLPPGDEPASYKAEEGEGRESRHAADNGQGPKAIGKAVVKRE